MDRELFQSSLKTEKLGRRLELFDVIPYSTNRRAAELINEGAGAGACVLADVQQGGRGRLGRSWQSGAPGESIAMSVVLAAAGPIESLSSATLLGAMAVRGAVAEAAKDSGADPESILIKWPNDVLIRGKKVCGILTEPVQRGGERFLIMGMGVNIAQKDMGCDLSGRACSLRQAGITASQEKLAAGVLSRLEPLLAQFADSGLKGLYKEYNAHLAYMNEPVTISDAASSFSGLCRGIDATGALLVETDGTVRRVIAGEVSLRGDFYGE